MEEEEGQGGAPNPTPDIGGSSNRGTPCEECGEQPWKYRCPGCSRLTCSLPCVQSHKRRTACTGKRPRTDPVPLAQFDDIQLLSDYNFLEETNHVRESAHRLIGAFGRNYGIHGAQLPKWLFFLRKAAQRRGIWLHFLPKGMARREHNRSRHNYRKDCIYWTLEWKFNSTDVILTDHNIDEHTSLQSLLERHLSPSPWKNQLTAYRNTDLNDLKLFIQKSAKESVSPYRQLNIQEPFGPQLRSITILEYPTINVFLPSDSCDFEVEKIANKLPAGEKPLGSSTDSPDLEGTEFHEEEIEEGELAPETQIIDLNDCETSHAANLSSAKDTSESKVDNKRDSSVLSYVSSLALDQQELNEQMKMAPDTASAASKAKNFMKVYPLDIEEIGEARSMNSERQNTSLKMDAASHPGNISLTLDQQELNEQMKMAHDTTSGASKAKNFMKVYPLDIEEIGEAVSLNSERQNISVKKDGASDPGNLAQVKGATVSLIDSNTDSLEPSSVSILASDGFSGPQVEQNQLMSKTTPHSTPEALKRKSCMKTYPLDTEEIPGSFSEVPDLGFEQKTGNAYSDLFGDMDGGYYFPYDLDIMDDDGSVGITSPFKLWDDLE
ncbi:hypothetical protein GUJ93_ZPchr0007g3350 [Zizania palustris]|uniref:Box C/D snoRNA protein 1 n=1 Tax=Zizania palustris TaxID=103762 RepID=A0A8J5TF57_ZIZPA|nr:hypothetical protein GUJ93_ZPchr0007g3350 [Zizania palustris]